MKNLKIIKFTACMALLFSLLLFTSCSDDDNSNDVYTGTPVIESVMPSGFDVDGNVLPLTPVSKGDPKNYYIIHGKGLLSTKKVYFNDYDTYFRPTFVTDTDIIILLDEDTPYADVKSQLKLVTNYGTAIFDFVVAPPVPTFKGFNPINAKEGDLVTIKGKYFLDPIVTLAATATQPAINIPVISSTLELITIKLPSNADLRYISVANISGAAKSNEAIGTAVFDDVSYYGLDFPDWNNFTYETDATAQQGGTYIAKKMDAWGSLQGNWGWFDQLSPYSGMRIAVKAKVAGKLSFVFNGNWEDKPPVLDVTTEWKIFYLPWSTLLNTAQIQNISFQNRTTNDKGDGVENTFYIDNIGFVLK